MDSTAIPVPSLAQRMVRHMLGLLASADRWTRGAYARNASGAPVRADSPDAVCFCTLGAFERTRFDLGIPYGEAGPVEQRLNRIAGRSSLPDWNDSHATYDTVIEALSALAA